MQKANYYEGLAPPNQYEHLPMKKCRLPDPLDYMVLVTRENHVGPEDYRELLKTVRNEPTTAHNHDTGLLIKEDKLKKDFADYYAFLAELRKEHKQDLETHHNARERVGLIHHDGGLLSFDEESLEIILSAIYESTVELTAKDDFKYIAEAYPKILELAITNNSVLMKTRLEKKE